MFNRLRGEFSFAYGNVLILLSVWAVTGFARYLPDTYYSLYVERLGASAILLGTVLSFSSFAVAFVQLAGGHWTDKYGKSFLY